MAVVEMGRGMEPRGEAEEEAVVEEEGVERERGAGEGAGVEAEEGRDTLVLVGREFTGGVRGDPDTEEGAGGAN